ncbi:MAG: DEAD/DEAH box helicase family protein [Alteromonas macleodii]|nr:DEAD/DEAH box helicase family protein [Alteromonas macleodii]
MDFSKLSGVATSKKVTDPIKLFEQLPNLPGTPNDIWRGQNEALSQWHENRDKKDVLVELNTGAGKTLVGLLIAQSLVNEGLQNVVYVCATVDLVKQTAKEAQKIGISCTLRVDGRYDNELFESGKAFCITTYHALFNGYSSIRRRHFPEAIIFDDAHVSEQVLRSCFTLHFSKHNRGDLYNEVVELFKSHFSELDKAGEFRNSQGEGQSKVVMATPCGVQERRAQLTEIFNRHKVYDDSELKYAYEYLKDRLDRCAVLFGYGQIEITPPFLPSLALDCLEAPIRRIYLSATLNYKSDFIRAYGRQPDQIISPHNDAGNGERLILSSSKLEESIHGSALEKLVDNHKVLIASPSYASAKDKWEQLGQPPSPENFSTELNNFREADNGAFILVQRVDGIDLPHETCRVMVIDGLPTGASLIEKYQWEFLRMTNVFAAKMANRLAQLFGRINRGRNDYGVFVISDKELSVFLNNDRYVALLPELIQKQLLLGRTVQEGMGISNLEALHTTVDTVLGRDASWLDYYTANIHGLDIEEDKQIRTEQIEEVMTASALAEAEYAKSFWEGDIPSAISALEGQIEKTLRADTPLAGWYNNWLGGLYKATGDLESAKSAYNRARERLGRNLFVPNINVGQVLNDYPLNAFGQSLLNLLTIASEEKYAKQLRIVNKELEFLQGGSPNQCEASVRALGELLGFHSTRPDNDEGTGPDVLWLDDENETALAFELKTDKKPENDLPKRDVGQGHDHISWVSDNYPTYRLLELSFVGDFENTDARANPNELMSKMKLAELEGLKNRVMALIDDIRRALPIERYNIVFEETSKEHWSLEDLLQTLASTPIRK